MQDAELLVQLAEIAGVFVGFGALISTTHGSAGERSESMYIRGVASIGLMVIVAALVPVAISRSGLTGHELWLLCSLIFLLFNWGVMVVYRRRPDYRALVVAHPRASRLRFMSYGLVLEVALEIALILIVLGPVPDLEPALYIAAVMLLLFQAAVLLTQLVYSQGHPAAG